MWSLSTFILNLQCTLLLLKKIDSTFLKDRYEKNFVKEGNFHVSWMINHWLTLTFIYYHQKRMQCAKTNRGYSEIFKSMRLFFLFFFSFLIFSLITDTKYVLTKKKTLTAMYCTNTSWKDKVTDQTMCHLNSLHHPFLSTCTNLFTIIFSKLSKLQCVRYSLLQK